jgi:hypothetical protein
MAFEYTKKFCGYLYVQGTLQGEDIPKVRGLGSCGSLVWSHILKMSPQWSITHHIAWGQHEHKFKHRQITIQ